MEQWFHKLKSSYKEQREYETIESEIAALEEKMDRWMYLEDLKVRIEAQ